MSKFRKKPVVIEARQYDGSNGGLLIAWMARTIDAAASETIDAWIGDAYLEIKTLEGTMRADKGDWIIRGVKGEFYPCKPDIFAATYDPAEVEPQDGEKAK